MDAKQTRELSHDHAEKALVESFKEIEEVAKRGEESIFLAYPTSKCANFVEKALREAGYKTKKGTSFTQGPGLHISW